MDRTKVREWAETAALAAVNDCLEDKRFKLDRLVDETEIDGIVYVLEMEGQVLVDRDYTDGNYWHYSCSHHYYLKAVVYNDSGDDDEELEFELNS